MARPALKPLLAATVGLTVLGLAANTSPAEAAVLNYSFDVIISQGVYSGSTYKGNFSFDNSKLVPCITSPSRLCATPGQSDFRLTFNFLGKTYTERSDVEYGSSNLQFPAIYYYPENVARGLDPYLISLIVLPPTSDVSFSILGYGFFTGFSNVANAGNSVNLAGRVSYQFVPPKPDPKPGDPSPCQVDPESCQGEAVPEPAEIAGSAVALGLLGLAWRSRRKKSALKV